MNKTIKKHFITLLKLSFAISIIYYMISTGKLDLHQIVQISHKKVMVIKVVLAIFSVYVLCTIRWYYLLIWQGIPAAFGTVAKINCTGIFFNSFMPGAVGGDLVKAFYIAKENQDHRTKAIITIIIDLILGFETLMIVAMVALLINYHTISSNPQLKALSIAICIYIFLSLLAAAAVFSKRVKRFLIFIGISDLIYKLPMKEKFFKIYDAFHTYADQKMRLVKAMAITIPLDILNIYAFFIIGREMGEALLSTASYFTAVPAGLVVASLPIAPAGIGVGQGAFYNLFAWFGASSGAIGATIITIYQLLMIAVNMCFVVVYLYNREEVNKAVDKAQVQ